MKLLLQYCIACSLCVGVSQAIAISDPYFTSGEDLDYLIESDNTLAIQEIEYELRKFVIFREVEDYFINSSSAYLGDDE